MYCVRDFPLVMILLTFYFHYIPSLIPDTKGKIDNFPLLICCRYTFPIGENIIEFSIDATVLWSKKRDFPDYQNFKFIFQNLKKENSTQLFPPKAEQCNPFRRKTHTIFPLQINK